MILYGITTAGNDGNHASREKKELVDAPRLDGIMEHN